jgi:hypothetical protein
MTPSNAEERRRKGRSRNVMRSRQPFGVRSVSQSGDVGSGAETCEKARGYGDGGRRG